jgi:hypothetical protein
MDVFQNGGDLPTRYVALCTDEAVPILKHTLLPPN